MFSSTLDRHDVLAAIRKTHGSAAAFERANHFPKKSVNEVLRGRANARVKRAIEELLHNRLESSNTDVSSRLRSEEYTSALQSLMRISFAVFCLKKKTTTKKRKHKNESSY